MQSKFNRNNSINKYQSRRLMKSISYIFNNIYVILATKTAGRKFYFHKIIQKKRTYQKIEICIKIRLYYRKRNSKNLNELVWHAKYLEWRNYHTTKFVTYFPASISILLAHSLIALTFSFILFYHFYIYSFHLILFFPCYSTFLAPCFSFQLSRSLFSTFHFNIFYETYLNILTQRITIVLSSLLQGFLQLK